ncbi:phage baseplate assembly protein V [Roseovarius pacificus]|uniref:phage baseplate assembly protein V n=1 Tax=Roseovarius pacificus TaxID=337701 RepID=UPI002A18A41E|nr:phage baseplate assembly protein V [Roseovarius pacificus]
MSWSQGDQDRRLHGGMRVGKVLQVDPAKARARVTLGGDTKTAWIPWVGRAGTIDEWAPPAVGEQVVVMSPGGDTSQGVILGSLSSNANPRASSDGGEYRVTIGNSHISMTGSAIRLSSNGSTIEMDATGIRLNGARIDLN